MTACQFMKYGSIFDKQNKKLNYVRRERYTKRGKR